MSCCSVFAPERAVAMIMCVIPLTVITLTRLSYNVHVHVGIHVCPCEKAHSKCYFSLSEMLLGVVR